MTKTLIGLDSTGTPCVKITKGTLDPVSTPDSEVSAFYFNSKWAKDIRLNGYQNPNYSGSSYFEGGSDLSTFTHYSQALSGSENRHFYRKSFFSGLNYNMPLMDYKPINDANGRFQTNRTLLSYLGYEERGGLWQTRNVAWYKDGWFATGGADSVTLNYGVSFFTIAGGARGSILLWDLPGDNTAIIDGAALPAVPGQTSIQINEAACRVAKPGYDVITATGTQLAFDSSKRPPKILAAADILIPNGYSEYETGVSLPSGCVVDAAFYTPGADIHYPCDPKDTDFGAEQWITGSKVAFNNPDGDCRARFIVVSPFDAAPTSGTNNVLRQFEEAGQNVVQFLRPGAADPPSFGDIILDSRWPCLQIIAEGYISVSSGVQQYPISINTTGLFPVVKFMTVHNAGSGVIPLSYSAAIKTPRVTRNATYKVSG